MPLADHVRIPLGVGSHTSFRDAETGTFVFSYGGGLHAIATHRSITGSVAPRVLIDLDTFGARTINSQIDGDDGGLAVPLHVQVDPTSAYLSSPVQHQPGDLLAIGGWFCLVARTNNGNAMSFGMSTLLPPSGLTPVGYRGWSLLTEDRVVFAKHHL